MSQQVPPGAMPPGGMPPAAMGGGGGSGDGPPPQAPIPKYKAELRKAIRRNAEEPEINFLNITAMLDIMTIILVFLLKSLGEDAASAPQSDDLRLPVSVLQQEMKSEGIVVILSKSQILLGDQVIVKLPKRESMVQSGVGARHKRSGPNDLFIVPLGNALQSARAFDKQVRAAQGKDPSVSEAIIIADETTPYRLLIEVLFTLGQSEFGKYHMMVLQAE